MSDNFEDLFRRGYQARREGRYADSRAIFLDSVRKAAEHTDRPHLAEAFCGLAQAERDIGNLEAARHHYANAVLLYKQMGPPRGLAYALRHEADVLREMAQFAEADPLYVEAEGIYRKGGDESLLDLANTLRGLALTREATGEATGEAAGTQGASRPLWLEARELYARCNAEAGVAQCDQHLSA